MKSVKLNFPAPNLLVCSPRASDDGGKTRNSSFADEEYSKSLTSFIFFLLSGSFVCTYMTWTSQV